MSSAYFCPHCGTWLVGYFKNCPNCSKPIDAVDGGTYVQNKEAGKEMSEEWKDLIRDEIHKLDEQIERLMRMKKNLEEKLEAKT